MPSATSKSSALPCPCGGASYADCCQPLHAGAPAVSAEQLMRSRYSAYVRLDEAFLLASWHPSRRPTALGLARQPHAPTWLGLSVKRHSCDGDHAVVEFIARLRQGGGRARRLHEISHFVREDGRWYYVDGEQRE